MLQSKLLRGRGHTDMNPATRTHVPRLSCAALCCCSRFAACRILFRMIVSQYHIACSAAAVLMTRCIRCAAGAAAAASGRGRAVVNQTFFVKLPSASTAASVFLPGCVCRRAGAAFAAGGRGWVGASARGGGGCGIRALGQGEVRRRAHSRRGGAARRAGWRHREGT